MACSAASTGASASSIGSSGPQPSIASERAPKTKGKQERGANGDIDKPPTVSKGQTVTQATPLRSAHCTNALLRTHGVVCRAESFDPIVLLAEQRVPDREDAVCRRWRPPPSAMAVARGRHVKSPDKQGQMA